FVYLFITTMLLLSFFSTFPYTTLFRSGHLMIGGVDSVELAKKYGTPLYVFDISQIRSQIRKFKSAFEKNNLKYQISYASKAFAVDRKSTRLNSSHVSISYAVFCLKKKI